MEIAGIYDSTYSCASCICARCLKGGIHPQSDRSCSKCISNGCTQMAKTTCNEAKLAPQEEDRK